MTLLTMLNPSSGCESVHGERIVGTDLARALPAFSTMPADAAIAYSPAPGTARVFLYPELKRIGAKYGIEPRENTRVCFEWPSQWLSDDAIRDAVRESLHAPQAKVEIIASSQRRAPEGKLEFPLSGLSVANQADPQTPVVWRGHIVYGRGRRFEVWVRLRVAATTTRVVAIDALQPGKMIEKDQVRLETYDDFPLHNDIARSLEEVIGRVAIRAVRAQSPVLRADLTEPFQVQRGESVEVTVIAGAAQVKLEAMADGSGRQGDSITLTNPRSGKRFRARIEGRDRALVMAGLTRVQ